MKNRGLFVFGILTFALVAYVAYDFRVEKKENERKEEASRLFLEKGDQVKEVAIIGSVVESQKSGFTSKISNVIKLNRSTDGWKFEEPLSELADSSAVQDFVDGITEEKAISTVSEGDGIDWKIFGLEEPKGQIVLTNNLGERTGFSIGTKKNYQGEAFVRRNSENRVYLVAGTWLSKVEKTVFQFRDRRLLKVGLSQLKTLDFRSKSEGGGFSLRYEDHGWVSKDRPGWKLEQNKVREVLSMVSQPSVTEFVKEGGVSEIDLKGHGCWPGVSAITFGVNEGAGIQLITCLDKDKNNYVYDQSRGALVKITAADAAKINQLKLDLLRDRKEPFAFDKPKVRRIEINHKAGHSIFERKEDEWRLLESSDSALKVDSAQIQGLLVRLETLEVAEFIDKKMALPGKTESVILKDADGKIVFELSLGEVQKKKLGGLEKTVILASTNLFQELVSVEQAASQGLSLSNFVKAVSGEKK